MDANFKLVVNGDDRYLAVYTDQDEVKSDDLCVKLIHTFNDMLKIFFYEGTLDEIMLNPDTDNVILSVDKIFNILTNRIMTNSDLFKEALNTFNEKEISFIGYEKYNKIRKIYFENKNPKMIMEEDNLTAKEIDYYLSDGYSRIKRILRSRLI